jgi:hypothetical protein
MKLLQSVGNHVHLEVVKSAMNLVTFALDTLLAMTRLHSIAESPLMMPLQNVKHHVVRLLIASPGKPAFLSPHAALPKQTCQLSRFIAAIHLRKLP